MYGEEISVDFKKKKTEAIHDSPIPKSVSEIYGFLRMA